MWLVVWRACSKAVLGQWEVFWLLATMIGLSNALPRYLRVSAASWAFVGEIQSVTERFL